MPPTSSPAQPKTAPLSEAGYHSRCGEPRGAVCSSEVGDLSAGRPSGGVKLEALDLPALRRQAARRPADRGPDGADGARESGLGLQADPGRTARPGHSRRASTVRRVLKRRRIPPAQQRSRSSWSQFLRTQASTMLACDFFHVESVKPSAPCPPKTLNCGGAATLSCGGGRGSPRPCDGHSEECAQGAAAAGTAAMCPLALMRTGAPFSSSRSAMSSWA